MSDILLPALGWCPEQEEQHNEAIAEMCIAELTCAAPANIPETLDSSWFKQQSQGKWPSCHSHMRTGATEVLAWMRTKGKVFQFSRKFGFITDLRMDGNDSRPAGASIGGSMRASQKYGEALEELFPYYKENEGYSNAIPANVMNNAQKHRVTTLVPGIRSYDKMDAGLVTGNCALAFGMDWFSGWDDLHGVKELSKMPRGSFRGGHALMVYGWITKAGERWHCLHNSHPEWGVDMRTYVSPQLWDAILKSSQYGAYLVSDMTMEDIVVPRGWDWLETANFGGTAQLNLS